MSIRPKISIIIPVFNIEKYIGECLDSILCQDLDSFEIICINDGSIDNSEKIVKEYQKRDSIIKLINQLNKGLSSARNKGISYATGEYIMFVDGDDLLEPEVLGRLYDLAINNNLDILDFRVNLFKNNIKKDWRMYYLPTDTPISGKEYFNRYIERFKVQPFIAAWSHLYRREFIIQNKLHFIDGRYYEDLPFTAEAYLLAKCVLFYDIKVYNYRFNENSITKKTTVKHLEDNIFISQIIFNLSLKHNNKIPMDNFFNAFVKQIISFAKNGGYQEIMSLLHPNIFKRNDYNLFQKKSFYLDRLLRCNFMFCSFTLLLRYYNSIIRILGLQQNNY